MRHLYILAGAPGCGKTSFVKQARLTDHALGLDDVRSLVCPTVADADGVPSHAVTPATNRLVLRIFEDAVTTRLTEGETLVLDCTHPNGYKKLVRKAQAMGYDVTYIDCQGSATVDELIERQERRLGTRGYVVPSVIERMAPSIADSLAHLRAKGERVLDASTPAGVRDVIETINQDHYMFTQTLDASIERLVVIGDVQSCVHALARAEAALDLGDPATKVVFVGDLFDRGPDAGSVAQTAMRLLRQGAVFIEGNHDTHMRHVNRGLGDPNRLASTWASHHQIMATGMKPATLDHLLDAMVPAYPLYFGGHTWLFTHAGIGAALIDKITDDSRSHEPVYDLLGLSANTFIRGSSDRQNTYYGSCDYSLAGLDLLRHDHVVQAFGHRNGGRKEQPAPLNVDDTVLPLEARVEHGGELRILEVFAEGEIRTHTFTQN